MLGLLKLPDDVKKMVEKNSLSMSHARVLSKFDDEEKIVRLAKKVITENLSVHELERLSQEERVIEQKVARNSNYDHRYHIYENILIDKLNTKVKVGRTKMEIYFNSKEELNEILTRMNISFEEE